MSKIAIKINSKNPLVKCLVPLREFTSLGITEIKHKIDNQDILAETDTNDITGLELKDPLNKMGLYLELLVQQYRNNFSKSL